MAKTARSTERSVSWTYAGEASDFLQKAKESGDFILALEITDESQSLLDYELPPLVAGRSVYLIAGNEASGVSQDLLDSCNASVHLPMHGQNTSMNVAVATGAAVYLLLRQM